MFTAEEAGVAGTFGQNAPPRKRGWPHKELSCGSRLFASHCQEEIKEHLPLPSSPNGMLGAEGGAVAWAGNHKGPKLLSSAVSSAQSRYLIGVSSRQLELRPSIPNLPEQVQRTLTIPQLPYLLSSGKPTDGHGLRFPTSRMGFLGLAFLVQFKSIEH